VKIDFVLLFLVGFSVQPSYIMPLSEIHDDVVAPGNMMFACINPLPIRHQIRHLKNSQQNGSKNSTKIRTKIRERIPLQFSKQKSRKKAVKWSV
jgi:hypothetical protein